MPETPEADRIARDIAENVYAAYAHRATSAIPPGNEQLLLARLAEAIRPVIGQAPEDIVAASNAVLDDWESNTPDVHGPRVMTALPADGSVVMGVR